MMLRSGLTAVLLMATACTLAAERPNVILILADDLGIVDINAYAERFTGATPAQMYYETPHLDRLIREGTAFSQAYACHLCSPARSSLLTGKYAARIGFTTAVGGNVQTFYNQGLTPPEGYLPQDAVFWTDKLSVSQALLNGTTIDALPAGQPDDAGHNEVTIAEAMPGHRSAFLGKWHVGGHGSRGYQPPDQGFEPLAYLDEGASPYFDWQKVWNNRKLAHPRMPQPELLRGTAGPDRGEQYLTDELTAHAVSFLKEQGAAAEQSTRPFFLYLCHFAVHTPFQAPEQDVAYFETKATRGWNQHNNPTYAAMIKRLDASIGNLLATLDETGLAENTIVALLSDNGGVTYTDPVATCNAPFKGGKALHYEGGIRVPLVFYWKGHLPGGRWCDVPVDCNDIFPTLLDLTGYELPPDTLTGGIDGQSLRPLLDDPANVAGGYSRDTFFWHYPLNVVVLNPDDGVPSAPSSAIRERDWKLIFDWSGAARLYNIRRDPFEHRELSAEYPEKTATLFRRLNDWIDSQVAVKYTPALNPDYDPTREVRPRPFVDLRRRYLGPERAIRAASSDPRFNLVPAEKPAP